MEVEQIAGKNLEGCNWKKLILSPKLRSINHKTKVIGWERGGKKEKERVR